MKRNRPPIEHIVVLMMENHSYDNYLGMLQCRGEGGLERTPGPGGAFLAGPRASHTR